MSDPIESWEEFSRDAELIPRHDSGVACFRLNDADRPYILLSFRTNEKHVVYPFTVEDARVFFVKLDAKIAEAEDLDDAPP